MASSNIMIDPRIQDLELKLTKDCLKFICPARMLFIGSSGKKQIIKIYFLVMEELFYSLKSLSLDGAVFFWPRANILSKKRADIVKKPLKYKPSTSKSKKEKKYSTSNLK